MRWLVALGAFVATAGCAAVPGDAEELSLRFVEARAEGSGPTDPVWIVVDVTHALPDPVTLSPETFSLRDADGRSFEFYDGYVEREAGARAKLPVLAEPDATYEVHLQGYLVGAPPEPPLSVRWTHGVERASATFDWPPR